MNNLDNMGTTTLQYPLAMKGVITYVICLLSLTSAVAQQAWGPYASTNALSANSWFLAQDWASPSASSPLNMRRLSVAALRSVLGDGVWQAGAAALTNLANNPNMFHATNQILALLGAKTLSGSGNIPLTVNPTIDSPNIIGTFPSHTHLSGSTGSRLGAGALSPTETFNFSSLEVTNETRLNSLLVTNDITGDTVSDSVGDLRDAINAVAFDGTIAEITDAAVTWTEMKEFDDLRLRQAASYEEENSSGATLTVDIMGAPKLNLIASGDVTISMAALPTENTFKWRSVWVTITNPLPSNILYTGPEGVNSRDNNYPTGVIAERILDIVFVWDGTNVTFNWHGPQDGYLSKDSGGTFSPYGVAIDPEWFLHEPLRFEASSSNTFDIEHSRGTRAFLSSGTNTYIRDVSGVPASDTQVDFLVRLFNTNSASYWELNFNPSWHTKGFESPYYVTNGTWEVFWVRSSHHGVWVDNEFQHVAGGVSGGGGSPPASTLFDDILANWKFEETTGTTVDDEVGSLNLAEFGGVWTKNVSGINGQAWTNISTGRVLTNSSTTLELGRAGASFTVAAWWWPNAIGAQYLFGEANTGSDTSWYARLTSGGYLQFYASTTGGAPTAFTSTFLTTTTRQLVVASFDNANNLIKLSRNGEPFQTAAFAGDMFDAAANFSVGGVFVSSAVNASRANYDEVTVWDVAITDAQVAEHYALGVGSFYP